MSPVAPHDGASSTPFSPALAGSYRMPAFVKEASNMVGSIGPFLVVVDGTGFIPK